MFRSRLLLAGLSVLMLLGIVAPAALASAAPALSRAVNQTAVERVLWSHRIWPAANPQPKPAFESVMTPEQIRAKVDESLRLSAAVVGSPAGPSPEPTSSGRSTGRPVTRSSQTCSGSCGLRWATTPRPSPRPWPGPSWPSGPFDLVRRPGAEAILRRVVAATGDRVTPDDTAAVFEYHLPAIGGIAQAGPGTWNPTFALPEANIGTSSVWTGTEMIIWGGTEAGLSKYNSGSRYDPVTDTWRTTSGTNAPFPRKQHTAVWTGTEMIVWGGCGLLDEHNCQINSGGRYNPATDTWTATTTAVLRRLAWSTPRCGPVRR
jgi:hypothetical protein